MNSQSLSRIPARASFLAIALVVLLASSFASASTPQGTFEKTFQVSGPVDLEVQTHSGDIMVRSGPSGSVTVRGKIYVGDHWLFGSRHTDVSDIEQHPPLRQEGNSIRIDYVTTRDISVDYEITVPEDTAIRTHSGSGDQTIEGTRGNTDLQSGSGDLRLDRLTGEIRVHTGSGDVRAREISGPVRGGAGSGDIEIEETGTGDIDLHTGSGNIRFMVFKAHSMATPAAATLPPRARRRADGRFAPDRATCTSICRRTRPSMPTISTSSGSLDVGPADHHDRAGAGTGNAQAYRGQSPRRRPAADCAHFVGRYSDRVAKSSGQWSGGQQNQLQKISAGSLCRWPLATGHFRITSVP